MDFFLVLKTVLVMFLLILVGFVVRKKLFSDQGHKDLTQLLIYVFLPCTLIRAFNVPYEYNAFVNASKIFVIMVVAYAITTVISVFLSKFLTKDKPKQAILIMAMTLPNVGFMGYPVIESILGKEYIIYAIIANIVFELLSWVVMLSILKKYTNSDSKTSIVKQIISTPPLIAIAFGLLVYFSPVKIPEPFFGTINLLGNAMTPVAMIIVGMSLAKADLKSVLFKKELYLASFVKLVVYPLLMIFVLKQLKLDPIVYTIPAILFAMPTAGYTSIISAKYGADDAFASEAITFASLLSMITLPLILSLI